MTIKLRPDLEARVREAAAVRGIDLNTCAQDLIEQGLQQSAIATAPQPPGSGQSLLEMLTNFDPEDATDDPEEIARRTREAEEIMQHFEGRPHPDQATLDLLARWQEENAPRTPEECQAQQEEADEFMQNLARNRYEMEGPHARKLWP